jgi:hypothetical protein
MQALSHTSGNTGSTALAALALLTKISLLPAEICSAGVLACGFAHRSGAFLTMEIGSWNFIPQSA